MMGPTSPRWRCRRTVGVNRGPHTPLRMLARLAFVVYCSACRTRNEGVQGKIPTLQNHRGRHLLLYCSLLPLRTNVAAG